MTAAIHAVVCASADEPSIGGVAASLRVASALRFSAEVAHVLIASTDGARELGVQAERLSFDVVRPSELPKAVSDLGALLVVSSGGMPSVSELLRFAREASQRAEPSLWLWHGSAIALYDPNGKTLREGSLSSCGDLLQESRSRAVPARIAAPESAWFRLDDPRAVRDAEAALFSSLGRESDGYLTRLDRPVSIALSRLLVRTPVTPNAVTSASLIVGLAGAVLVASGGYTVSVLGTVAAWLSAILDGCDGEIARLKLMASESGRRFDLAVDHVVNFAVLIAVPWHVHRTRPDLPIALPAALLAGGVLLSMAVLPLMLRRSDDAERAALDRFLERVASRDFVYVLVPLAVASRLEWFLYGSAAGANLFWISAAAVSWRRRAGRRR